MVFKPLNEVDETKEKPEVVIFFVDPHQFSALAVLANYGRPDNENVIVITSYSIHYTKLYEDLNDGVYFVDPERKITFWNKAAERITGFDSEEVIGRCCSENILVHVDFQGTNLCINGCPLAETLRDGRWRECEVV